MSKLALILFDFDGTVIDGSEGIYNCINYALEKMGLPLPDENTLRKFIGPSLFDSFRAYCEDDAEKADRFAALYRERYAPTGYAEARLYDGIEDVFAELKNDGYKVAICSSKPYDFVVKIARKLGIFDMMDGFFCPGFSSRTSEKHELIAEGAARFGVTADETLMVGDRCFDIDAAVKAGVHSLGVRYGFSEGDELERSGAERVAETVADICPMIKELSV